MIALFAFAKTFIGGLPWKVIVLVVGVFGILAGGAYIVHEIKRAAQLETQLDGAIEISNANAALAEKHDADVKRADDLIAKGVKKKTEIRRKSDEVRRSIIDALPADDAPLAPVLRDELDRLPAPDGADPHGGAAADNRST